MERAAAESLLDQVLMELLHGTPDAHADVFVESTRRLLAGSRFDRAGERASAPRLRDDDGVALRLVLPECTRATHVTGGPDERLLPIARALAQGAAASPLRATAGAAREGDGGLAPARGLLAKFAEAAQGALRDERRLESLDVQVTRVDRSVHVASSEWGHANESVPWETANVQAEVRPIKGGTVRASRGVGLPRIPADLDVTRLVAGAVAAACARLDARPPLSLRPVVIVAPGAGGILVHEAVGHALEGDVVARGSSYLSGRQGERVAHESLTVIDDPGIACLAGSRAHDDEGAPARRVTLIERGVLRGVLTDGVRAEFRKSRATGHGRRQGFRDLPLPRLSNTLVLSGEHAPQDLLGTTPHGILATRFERASADPLRGRFQLRVTEGFLIEDGRLTAPIEETLLVGISDAFLHGLEIGSDLEWDDGCGTCGREGQWVPVAVGQPTLRIAEGAFLVA
jgi:TldD protein